VVSVAVVILVAVVESVVVGEEDERQAPPLPSPRWSRLYRLLDLVHCSTPFQQPHHFIMTTRRT